MDTQKARQFLGRFSRLPREAQVYLDSTSLSNFTDELSKKYNVPSEYYVDLGIDLIVGNINFSNVRNKIKSDLNKTEKEARAIARDFIGITFLPVDAYFKDYSIPKIVHDLGGRVADYRKYLDSFREAIEDENDEIMDEALERYDELVDEEDEFNSSLILLEKFLIDILKSNYADNQKRLNGGLIMLLNKKDRFKISLEKPHYQTYLCYTAR